MILLLIEYVQVPPNNTMFDEVQRSIEPSKNRSILHTEKITIHIFLRAVGALNYVLLFWYVFITVNRVSKSMAIFDRFFSFFPLFELRLGSEAEATFACPKLAGL